MRGDAAWRARGHAPGMPVPAQGVQQPRPRQPPWAGSQGMGMQHPRLGRAHSSQGLGVHAATKAKARSQGHGMLAWARWYAPGRRQQGPWGHAAKAVACRVPEGQWQHGEGVACPVGRMPRPWHAFATPRRPWRHLGGLLLPSLDSLFGHLQLFHP